MSICSQEKKNLVEVLGIFFQDRHKLPPLAARIYAILVLSSDDGYSFDDFIEITQASKSSISTNLNLLISLKFIEFFTKTGNRKRYFRSSGSYIKNMLNEHFEAISKELEMVQKINDFNRNNNHQISERRIAIGKTFQTYLETEKKTLEKTLNEIKTLKRD
ncbi:GbsR/MarR family transcriptional regulator [Maribacter sp. X9]|uniref:GbsR/MarR family transcriptional regulator n=1 Tax=Maribacter sp. X9 TaxID=3402159 RepID=UPI003AF3ACB7